MMRIPIVLFATLCLTGCVGMQTPKTLEIDQQVLFNWNDWVKVEPTNYPNSYRTWRWQEWTRYDRNGDGRVDLIERTYKASWLIDEVWDDSKLTGFFDRHYYRAGDASKYQIIKVHVDVPRVPPNLE